MLARLEMLLKSEGMLSGNMSSLFHGALMEMIPSSYADEMHVTGLHPYTQHLEYRNGDWYWIITCLNRRAVDNIISHILLQVNRIHLKKLNQDILIIEKKYSEIPIRSLTDCFYEEICSRFVEISFITPAAFKSQGRYVFYPDIHSIYQSLMNKYSSANEKEDMTDEDTLETLTDNTQIIRYDLRSTTFSLEGTRIPSFTGKVTFKITGAQTMINFANMLFRFGEYSGIGIKTAIGMGAIRIIEHERSERRKEKYDG